MEANVLRKHYINIYVIRNVKKFLQIGICGSNFLTIKVSC